LCFVLGVHVVLKWAVDVLSRRPPPPTTHNFDEWQVRNLKKSRAAIPKNAAAHPLIFCPAARAHYLFIYSLVLLFGLRETATTYVCRRRRLINEGRRNNSSRFCRRFSSRILTRRKDDSIIRAENNGRVRTDSKRRRKRRSYVQ
jgi:hypothetical protein